MSFQRLTAMKVRIASLVKGRYHKGQKEMEPNVLITPGGTTVSRIRVLGTVVSSFINDDGTYASVTLDDGSETIRVKGFRDDLHKIKDLGVGDTIDIIGRVREYEGELYLIPETVLTITDHNWELVRRLELLREDGREQKVLDRADELKAQGKGTDEIAAALASEFGLSDREVAGVLSEPMTPPPVTETLDGPAPVSQAPTAGDGSKAATPVETGPGPRAALLALIQKLDEGDGVPYAALKDASKMGDEMDDVLTELITEGEIFEPRTGKYKRLD
ncbi:MAG: OB-fold nucleic acid binding domain-containing protein [Candidatus Undinarchaeales archaeon]|jgi:RPA family protein|nr:OB-fold nucleic acid binding domain-containing protein [Candidatus Undinarchaeales archaeon]MDP7493561.1 OB-fold nucleic acid binding domain-containing protein [Candidatus Undinarchaeales archaeon]